MKTKVFTYNTGGDFLILALARIVGNRCFVNFVFSNDQLAVVYPSHLKDVSLKNIADFAKSNDADEIYIWNER